MTQSIMAVREGTEQDLLSIYLKNAHNDVWQLETLKEEALANVEQWPDLCRRMRDVVHNVKGQGSSFGYPLMTRVGESLSLLLKRADAPDPMVFKLLAAHIETLRTVLEKDIKGAGGEVGDALADRLESLVDKLA